MLWYDTMFVISFLINYSKHMCRSRNISSLRWISTSRYRELTVFQKNITLISVYEKITSQSLETPSHSPTIFSKKNIKGKIYTYAFGLCKQKHSFFRIFKLIIRWSCFEQLIRKDMTQHGVISMVDKNIYRSINLSRAAFGFWLWV